MDGLGVNGGGGCETLLHRVFTTFTTMRGCDSQPFTTFTTIKMEV
jgi:hypothetical protein